MSISGIGNGANMYVSLMGSQNASQTARTNSLSVNAAGKPVWDGKKAYKYLEDFNSSALDYGKKAAKYYATKTTEDGAISVDDVKSQINELFPDYTLTNREPNDVVKGKDYLYIDDSQMKKLAEDPDYRAKVYGLMDRELNVGKEYTLTYSDGVNKTLHSTGSVFSLAEKNRKYAGPDGIPYLGSGSADNSISSSDSHPQVRSMSFLTDHLDPAKAARKSRTSAAKAQAERLAKKRSEKKQAEKKREDKNATAQKESQSPTYSINKMSKADRDALVSKLKAEAEERQNQLVSLVEKTLNGQVGAFGKATGDNIWKALAGGNVKVDPATRAQAQKDIGEDGYWGVKQTSQRLFDFASALAGDDVEKMKKMQAAMEKGFKQATAAWGRDLPSISLQTLDAANKLFEDYYNSKETAEISAEDANIE